MDLGSILIIVGLVVAVVAFLARPLAENRVSAVTAGDHRLSALQAERDKILTVIREIEMDHAMGKIREHDFQEQRAALVARGATALRELDALGGAHAAEDVDAAIEAAVAERRGRTAPKAAGLCVHCGRALQRGDRFCASCGTPVPQEKGA
ncbi:MAG: zinc ribbon domain-containing protein [Chloroflexi bacterium]|nr:zinc ribbon domain-containing protein [Chloroflexota bacterium]